VKIAIAGCGYVADFYMETLPNHPTLELVAACDINPERRAAFGSCYAVPMYASVDELLARSDAELVLNLTDPRSHHAVSQAILKAGRHLYSEKPLAMEFEPAQELVQLAKSRGLSISGAPCNAYSESAEAVRRALTAGKAGIVRAVFAEMSEGRPSLASVRRWRSASGAPWPYADEFELGSTVQHAGYCISLLTGLFGPVSRVHSLCGVLRALPPRPAAQEHEPRSHRIPARVRLGGHRTRHMRPRGDTQRPLHALHRRQGHHHAGGRLAL
jgi:predicted dehydrogenase